MADLKNLGKFAASVAAEAESIVASARRQLDRLIEEKARELGDVERAAAAMLGGSFEALFKAAALVSVREFELQGYRDEPSRLRGIGMTFSPGNVQSDSEYNLFHERLGRELANGRYRAIVVLLPLEPMPDAAK